VQYFGGLDADDRPVELGLDDGCHQHRPLKIAGSFLAVAHITDSASIQDLEIDA
jgi:hypothetical protein